MRRAAGNIPACVSCGSNLLGRIQLSLVFMLVWTGTAAPFVLFVIAKGRERQGATRGRRTSSFRIQE